MKLLVTYCILALPIITFCQRLITVEDFTTKSTFVQKTIRGINWMKDGEFYTSLSANRIVKYNILSGEPVDTLFDGSLSKPTIPINSYVLSDQEDKILILTNRQSIYRRSFLADYLIYFMEEDSLIRFTPKKISYATFSPDGNFVAYTRDNNLFYFDLVRNKEVAITTNGTPNQLIHGSGDWVYEEEFRVTKAFYWSPDNQKIAFISFDESSVKEYTLQRWTHGRPYPENYQFKYPKPGEDNSKVSVSVYDLKTGTTTRIDTGKDQDQYLPRLQWTNDPDLLSIIRMNRQQNKLEILHVNVNKNDVELILTERSKTYVHLNYIDDLTYLKNGRHFIFSSEREGNKHFYLHTMDGQMVSRITQGGYEALTLVGVDESSRNGLFYYISTEDSPLERHFYVVGLNGKSKKKLSVNPGIHQINMSSDFKYYMDYHSAYDQPLEVSLYETRGNKLIRSVEDNQELKATIEKYQLAEKTFFTLTLKNKTLLNGYLLKPEQFDSSKVYPMIIFQYSGPGSQQVLNNWGGGHFYFHQMMVQEGYLVAVIDPRGTGGRGVDFKKITYKELGKYESLDLIESANILSEEPFVDKARIGIWGWSYGGFMSSLCMFKSDVFKAGIAVSPVTNWRFYDTIYTERYLNLPQHNPNGYDNNSPVFFVDGLKGKFFLIHGTGDDNVHFQNSILLQDALIKAGKQFETFYYPDQAHSIRGGRNHLYRMMAKFWKENL